MYSTCCRAATMIFLLVAASGCERPPVPERKGPAGPPQPVAKNSSDEARKPAAKAKEKEKAAPASDSSGPALALPTASVAPAPAPAAPATNPPTPPPMAGTATAPVAPPTPAAPAPGAPAPPPGNVESAAGRVGEKGKQYGSGFVATPIAAYATVRERLPMLQIQHSLGIFKAEHGVPPRDMEEFTERILKPLNVKLPELPEGESYFFDKSREPHGELMIRRPAPAQP